MTNSTIEPRGSAGYIALALSSVQLIFTLAGGINDLAALPNTVSQLMQPVQERAATLQKELKALDRTLQETALNSTKDLSGSIRQFSAEFQYLGSQLNNGVKRVRDIENLENEQSTKAALESLEIQSSRLEKDLAMLNTLSLEIEASQEAAKWLETEAQQKSIAKQLGETIISELALQGTLHTTDENITFYLDIAAYLFLIHRCLKSCRTDFIDAAITQRKVLRSKLFTTENHTRVLFLARDTVTLNRNLSQDAESQFLFYLNYLEAKIRDH
jgi:hypothetical protein